MTKVGPRPLVRRIKSDYPHHKRATRVYGHWLSGYVESEIAGFFGISEAEVERDVQHVQAMLSPKVIIAQHNDRARILLQRAQSENYRRLLGQALEMAAEDYLRAGLTPATVLREYREAVGMQERPAPQSVNVTTCLTGNAALPRSPEEIIRHVRTRMAEPQRGPTGATPPTGSLAPADTMDGGKGGDAAEKSA